MIGQSIITLVLVLRHSIGNHSNAGVEFEMWAADLFRADCDFFVKTELYIHNGSTITIKGDSIELHCAFFLHIIYHFISVR